MPENNRKHSSDIYRGRGSTQHRRRFIGRESAQDVGGAAFMKQVTALSLFLILLAFFIVMNTLSEFQEDKTRPVMRSVESAFSSKLDKGQDEENPSILPSQQKSIYEGQTVERIEALFTAQIPGFRANVNRGDGVMFVRVPYQAFRNAVLAVGQTNALAQEDRDGFTGAFFLPTLVALMSAGEAGVPYQMEVLYNIKGNPARQYNRDAQGTKAAMAQIASLSAKINEAGVPAHLMSVGVQHGDKNTVDLYFRPGKSLAMRAQ